MAVDRCRAPDGDLPAYAIQITAVDDRDGRRVLRWRVGRIAQGRTSWRDYVREHGDTSILVDLYGPITGLKEIVEITQLIVEGTITVAEGKLTSRGDEVYTEYEIDVIRVRRGIHRCARQPATNYSSE